MNIQNENSLCMEALPYLFDVLNDVVKDIPAEILSHIRQCSHCRDEIAQLKLALEGQEPADGQQAKIDAAVAASLDLHYTYNGKMVGCRDIRAFLPSLTDPLLKIRVPTPITVHIDNCRQCADDFETIQQMHLTHRQLCRLGQVFAEAPAEDTSKCAEAATIIPFVARLDSVSFKPADALEHLCTCLDCRTLLYEKRNAVLAGIASQTPQGQSPCRQVSASEIFDYVIPYGLDPHDREDLASRKSFVSHVLSCPVCFGKVQEMHTTLFEILERSESGIVTRCDISDADKSEKDSSSPYAAWPVKVEVFTPDQMFSAPSRFKTRLPSLHLRPFIKPAAAAAVILFALLFYLNAPIAHATDLAQIYKAVANIVNIRIASFVPDKAEPIQEQWVAKALDISIFKTPPEMIVWDIPNGSKRVKNIIAGTVEVTSIPPDKAADIKKNIEGSLGLLPFSDLSQKPQDAVWQEAADVATTSADINAYDLMWTEKSSAGSVVFKKWRVFVDSKTSVPQRVEWYAKANDSDEYLLETYQTVEYLSEAQMQAVIREAAF